MGFNSGFKGLNGVAIKRNSCRQGWTLQYRPKQAFRCSYSLSPSWQCA